MSQAGRIRGETPLLPLEDAREAALFFVVSALCFLAALAALSARATYGAAEGWTSQVEGQLTVRLRGADARDARDARVLTAETEGVIEATILSDEETGALLQPWFGAGGLPAGLPLPTLIAVKADPSAVDVGPTIARRLTEGGLSAVVDEHADWAGDVRRVLRSVRIAAFSAVALLAATAIAVIAFATHAALLARRDIVEVLHLSGAQDRFIANLFERRFWVLGLRAGSVGALAALGAGAFLVFTAQSQNARNWLLPTVALDIWDLLVLIATPLTAGLAARFATRVTVMRTLGDAG